MIFRVGYKRGIAVLATTLVLATVTAGSVAVATPSTGPATTLTTPVVGMLDDKADAAQDGISLTISADTIVRDFELTYPKWADSGWHEHPGIVVATVKIGTVYRVSAPGCKVETFNKGDSFTEVGAHRVFNHSKASATLSITQFLPGGTDLTKTRIDVPNDPCKGKYHWS